MAAKVTHLQMIILEQKWNPDIWVVLQNEIKDPKVFLHIEQPTLAIKTKNIIYRKAFMKKNQTQIKSLQRLV